ncbi:hypothetical protein BU16DRAFT_563816 [Lophium mytilinum]|uniref:Clr5 domain-containing protein n=1 Tax=Lophium mytilinum TaxID=390894 RepID=A0A6A6QPM8_9PEZI|nr:hypothetical protein BU16DRAFT_563816 [Lophium mytilinum]
MSAPSIFVFTGHGIQSRSPRIPAEIWSSHKAEILQQVQQKGLAHTKQWMEDNQNFYATMKQYQYQIYTKWRQPQPGPIAKEVPVSSNDETAPTGSVCNRQLKQSLEGHGGISSGLESSALPRPVVKVHPLRRRLNIGSTGDNSPPKKARLVEVSSPRAPIIASKRRPSRNPEGSVVRVRGFYKERSAAAQSFGIASKKNKENQQNYGPQERQPFNGGHHQGTIPELKLEHFPDPATVSPLLNLMVDDGDEATEYSLIMFDHWKETVDIFTGPLHQAYYLHLSFWNGEAELPNEVHTLAAVVRSVATNVMRYRLVENILGYRLLYLSHSQATECFLFTILRVELYKQSKPKPTGHYSEEQREKLFQSDLRWIIQARDLLVERVIAGAIALSLPLLICLDRNYCYSQTGSAGDIELNLENPHEVAYEDTARIEERTALRKCALRSGPGVPNLTSSVIQMEPITNIIRHCRDEILSLEELELSLSQIASTDSLVIYDMVPTGLYYLLAVHLQSLRIPRNERGYAPSPTQIAKVVCVAIADTARLEWSKSSVVTLSTFGNLAERLYEAANTLLALEREALGMTFLNIFLSDRIQIVYRENRDSHVGSYLRGDPAGQMLPPPSTSEAFRATPQTSLSAKSVRLPTLAPSYDSSSIASFRNLATRVNQPTEKSKKSRMSDVGQDPVDELSDTFSVFGLSVSGRELLS